MQPSTMTIPFIQAATIGEAWQLCLKKVLAEGIPVPDDKGMIREVSPLYVAIHEAAEEDPILERFAKLDSLAFMARNFESLSPLPGWGYSYAQRLYRFHGHDQIELIRRQLVENRFSKSATISLLDPDGDRLHKPCLATLDFKIRGESLHVHAFFRSQDIGKKMYADAVEILRLSHRLSLEGLIGTVLHLSIASAHIYETDIPSLEKILSTP